MKERIDYYNNHGSALAQSRAKAKRSGIGLVHVVCRKLWSYSLSIIALWIPVSNLRVIVQRLRGVRVGKRVFIGTNVTIDNAYPNYVVLEEDCAINANVTIIAHSNPRQHFEELIEAFLEEVTIKRGAWIATGAIILPGVTVGEYSIVSAGSVVSKSVPPYSIVRGNPARVLASYPPELIKLDKIKKN